MIRRISRRKVRTIRRRHRRPLQKKRAAATARGGSGGKYGAIGSQRKKQAKLGQFQGELEEGEVDERSHTVSNLRASSQPFVPSTKATTATSPMVPPTRATSPKPFMYADGSKAWFLPGQTHRVHHRDGDKPALITANGDQVYMQHGKLHRERGPAFIGADGKQEYYIHGELVSGEKAAAAAAVKNASPPRPPPGDVRVTFEHGTEVFNYPNGSKGFLHHDSIGQRNFFDRQGNKPNYAIMKKYIQPNGDILHLENAVRHRQGDLPAVIGADGSKEWWLNGARHRERGPAVITANGEEFYYLYGNESKPTKVTDKGSKKSGFLSW